MSTYDSDDSCLLGVPKAKQERLLAYAKADSEGESLPKLSLDFAGAPKKKKKVSTGPTSSEMKKWLEQQKKENRDTEIAFMHCFSGMELYKDMNLNCSFKDFMLKYLGTAPIDTHCFDLALRMIQKDFKVYYDQYM